MKTVHRLVAAGLVAGSLLTGIVAGAGAVGAAEAERDIPTLDGPALAQVRPAGYTVVAPVVTQGAAPAITLAPDSARPDDRS